MQRKTTKKPSYQDSVADEERLIKRDEDDDFRAPSFREVYGYVWYAVFAVLLITFFFSLWNTIHEKSTIVGQNRMAAREQLASECCISESACRHTLKRDVRENGLDRCDRARQELDSNVFFLLLKEVWLHYVPVAGLSFRQVFLNIVTHFTTLSVSGVFMNFFR